MDNKPAAPKKQYWIDPMKCVGCSKCARNCPAQAIDAALIIDNDLCIGCGICDRFCWFGAVIVRTDGYVSDYHVHHHEQTNPPQEH